MCHISYFMCCVSPVTQRQQPQPHKLPLLTPPLCPVDWYAIMQTPKNLNIFQNSKQHQSGKKKLKWKQYALTPEVSSPPGSGFSRMAQTNTQLGRCSENGTSYNYYLNYLASLPTHFHQSPFLLYYIPPLFITLPLTSGASCRIPNILLMHSFSTLHFKPKSI